jgi:hypothetical protein
MTSKDSLLELMERFASGKDRSTDLASEIEVGLEEIFGDREPFADLSLALASYQPGGGEFLYGEQEMVALMKRVIPEVARLRSEPDEPPAPSGRPT